MSSSLCGCASCSRSCLSISDVLHAIRKNRCQFTVKQYWAENFKLKTVYSITRKQTRALKLGGHQTNTFVNPQILCYTTGHTMYKIGSTSFRSKDHQNKLIFSFFHDQQHRYHVPLGAISHTTYPTYTMNKIELTCQPRFQLASRQSNCRHKPKQTMQIPHARHRDRAHEHHKTPRRG